VRAPLLLYPIQTSLRINAENLFWSMIWNVVVLAPHNSKLAKPGPIALKPCFRLQASAATLRSLCDPWVIIAGGDGFEL